MKIVIEYTDGFEKFHTELGEDKKEHISIEPLKKSIECLEEQYNSLIEELSEIKKLLSEKEVESTGSTETPKNDGHISTYKHYDNYKLVRQYDAKHSRFFVSENRPSIDLGFIQLVAIIKAYKNGLSIKKMKNNPILSKYNVYTLQHYIYIWRAGGFNQAIKDHARNYGYNPDKLISHEVE